MPTMKSMWDIGMARVRQDMLSTEPSAKITRRQTLKTREDLPLFTPELNVLFAQLDMIVTTHARRRTKGAPMPRFERGWDELAEPAKKNDSDLQTASMMRLGSIAAHRPQVDFYTRTAASPLIRTVCEVGFNAGHSTAVWLLANPTLVVHSFDLISTPFAQACLTHLQARFPGRLISHRGDSTRTVPTWSATIRNQTSASLQRFSSCDLIHVDGRHSYLNTLTDFLNLLPAANPAAVVAFDDQCDPNRCDANRIQDVRYQPTLAVCDLLSARYLAPLTTFYEGERQFALFRLTDRAIERSGRQPEQQLPSLAAGRSTAGGSVQGVKARPKLPCARVAPLCVPKGPRLKEVPWRDEKLTKQQMDMRETEC
mmetsp:Transcript_3257/g.6820  ORF Transcript_3257/g.6820 Transcript_3257/m.6820 type:complete len:369 (-) Transcript_3257:373-1479(-)